MAKSQMDKYGIVGERLQTLRTESKLTLEEAAEQLHIVRQTLSKWETGISYPDVNDLLNLAKLYNCDFGYIIGEYDCRTRPVTDIVEQTGLTESAVNSLIEYKQFKDNPIPFACAFGNNFLAFFSAIITDRNMFTVVFDDLNDLFRIENEGLNEFEENTFSNTDEAALYKKFHIQQELIGFIETFVKGTNYGID